MLKSRTHTLCLVSVLAALYVPLSIFVAVQMGNVRISFGSLPVVVSALLLGPVEAVAVAMVGEFFKQLLTYGITATTVLYLIPPAPAGIGRRPCGGFLLAAWPPAGTAEDDLLSCLYLCSNADHFRQHDGKSD